MQPALMLFIHTPLARRLNLAGNRLPRQGFTLLELLTVIAIIAVLVGLGFGAARRATESGRVARARAELTLLASALEQYRQAYGDYPHTDEPAVLLQSLLGRRGPRGDAIARAALLELSRFTTGNGRDPLTDTAAVLLDPWDEPYRYAYQVSAAWRNSRYVLYSAGPDQHASSLLLPGGFPDPSPLENQDNLHADRP